MKITDNLVLTVNARLQDLKFELESIGMLETIEDDSELKALFDSIDINKSLSYYKEMPTRKAQEDEELEPEVPFETQQIYVLKTIMKDMKVENASGIIQMIANRSGEDLKEMDDVKKLYQTTEDHVRSILQADHVTDYLISVGLTTYAIEEINKVKDKKLNELFKVLGIQTKEV